MSKLVLLGGPTGVGKTTTLNLISGRYAQCAVLDADDVWRISPDLAVEGTRRIALENVISVMKGYFEAGCELGFLSWVFARPELFEPVRNGLGDVVNSIEQIYLISSQKDLESRLAKRGELDRLDYAKSRLALILDLPYTKIDTSGLTPSQVADEVCTTIEKLNKRV